MFDLQTVMLAFIQLAILLLLGRYLKRKTPVFQRLHLPESVLGGLLGLVLGPQVLGALITATAGPQSALAEGLFSEAVLTVWSQAPGVFINIVFACLLLGETIPAPKTIWRLAAPQVFFSFTFGLGQYVVGSLATLLILTPLLGANPIVGSLIELSFAGGHGTAGGMVEVFDQLGFPEGSDLALALATVSLISAIVLGTVLADRGRRLGQVATVVPNVSEPAAVPALHPEAETPAQQRRRQQLLASMLMDPLSLNVSIVAIAIGIGWVLLQGLQSIEALTWGRQGLTVFQFVPLFPLALVGGIITQVWLERTHRTALVVRSLMQNIAGVALDVVVIAAVATMSLAAVGDNLAVFLILAGLGIAWGVFIFLWWAPKIFPDFWFEKGLADFGQGMGVTSTGILLLRMVDSQNRTGAFESFAYKQIFFEPVLGGGLLTATSPVLIAQWGLRPFAAITTGLLLLCFGFSLAFMHRQAASRR